MEFNFLKFCHFSTTHTHTLTDQSNFRYSQHEASLPVACMALQILLLQEELNLFPELGIFVPREFW